MSNQDENLYIIRYSLPPEPTDARPRRLEELLRFCGEAKIDEVMFFLMPEEYNRGQWDPKDYRPWLDFAVQAKELVEKAGCDVSLNPWITLLHCSRGRRSEHLKYRRLVSDTGEEATAVACHLCPDWQKIFLNSFTDFAKAGFKTIWVEDDFRFHNHDHGWGGCFCDEHIRILRQRGAVAKNRQELIQNMNASDVVHPDRLIWMDLNSETYTNMASDLRAAMDAVDPTIQLGLMCSYIPTHSQEGRDWHGLLKALGGPELAPVRPHGAAYHEVCREQFMISLCNLSATQDVLIPGTRMFFELETGPMSRFSKSNQLAAANMAIAMEGQCNGLTLDVLSFIGNGGASEPLMEKTLAKNRKKLLTIRELVRDTEPVGITIMIPEDVTRFAPGTGKADMMKLPKSNYGWYFFLEAYGYPCQCIADMKKDIDTSGNKTYALAGEAVWGLSDELLEKLLSEGTLLLDAPAAGIIHQRGFGKLIGVNEMQWYRHMDWPFSIEQALNTPSGHVPERSGVNFVPEDWRLATFELNDCGEGKTEILDCYLKSLGIGTFLYRNASGGKGLVSPLSLPVHEMIYDWTKKRWLDRFLGQLYNSVPMPFLTDSAWVYITARQKADCRTIFLANGTYEIPESISIQLPADWTKLDWSILLHGREKDGSVEIDTNGLMRMRTEFVGADWLMLVGR